MGVRGGLRWVAVLAASAALLHAELLSADNVKLDGGGSVNGTVTVGSKAGGSKTVSVRTATGGVIVFERSAVKQITRGHAAAAKTASNSANGKAQPKKRKLTPEEESWLPKVHTFVSRLNGGDRARVQQAANSLLNIDDTDAIPALSTYLGSSHTEEARHLYVAILHNMKGPKPVYYLVAMSLFDQSVGIRSEARKAFREDQLDSARTLYIAALRAGVPKLARIAAIGLGEIGDPRGDSIPYLIDALVSYGTVATITEPAQYGVLYTITVYATPGLKMNDPSLIYSGQINGTSTLPVYLGNAGMTNAQASAALKNVTSGGTLPSGASGTMTIPGSFGGQSAQDFATNSKGMPNVQARSSGTFAVTPATADVYQLPIVGQVAPAHDKRIKGRADHPEVLDALIKITDQKYPGHGFNQDRWRNWWANEKTNRDLQKPPAPDRVIPGAAH
jgi:hypothetical protein